MSSKSLPEVTDIRWYKSKYKVKVIKKGKKRKGWVGNWLVEALEDFVVSHNYPTPYGFGSYYELPTTCLKGRQFVTIPRMLWRHPRK